MVFRSFSFKVRRSRIVAPPPSKRYAPLTCRQSFLKTPECKIKTPAPAKTTAGRTGRGMHGKQGLKQKIATAKRGIGRSFAFAMALTLCAAPTIAQSQTQSRAVTAKTAESKTSPWAFCERATVLTETVRKMPRALLFSVAMVESGRFNAETRKTRPWPWTINAEGQSFYFKSKKDAISATRRLCGTRIKGCT